MEKEDKVEKDEIKCKCGRTIIPTDGVASVYCVCGRHYIKARIV